MSGYSTISGDTAFHAFLSQNGEMIDLGTLGGPERSSWYRPNENGMVGGGSEIDTPNPHGEDFCGCGTHLICVPFVWWKGVMTGQPTLGGKNGMASGVNSRGQVTGHAEYDARNPSCLNTPS